MAGRCPIWRYSLVLYFACFNLLVLLYALVWPVNFRGAVYAWPEAFAMMILHGVVSAVLAYAAQQKRLTTEIAHKVYPAALVSYLLWACMMWRWVLPPA